MFRGFGDDVMLGGGGGGTILNEDMSIKGHEAMLIIEDWKEHAQNLCILSLFYKLRKGTSKIKRYIDGWNVKTI